MAISNALAWQLNNGGSADTLYGIIRDFLATSPDAATTQAQMAQYGISETKRTELGDRRLAKGSFKKEGENR